MPTGVPFASLDSTSAEWPDTARKPSTRRPDNGYIFKGYRLDGAGQFPEFRYLLNGIRRDLGFGAVPVRMNFRSSKNPFADKD